MIFVLFLITNIYNQGVIFMKEADIQESIVLANTLHTREVLAYNPQWGSFMMTKFNTSHTNDIRFSDVQRGDLLLCKRIERVDRVEPIRRTIAHVTV